MISYVFGWALWVKIVALVYLIAGLFTVIEIRTSPTRNDWEHKAPTSLT